MLLPFIAALVPIAFHLQGLYRLRRGRSRVDDFFAVFVGSILAVVFGIIATLYVQTYFASDAARDRGAFEVSQVVWGIFLVLNVAFTFASRELVREILERRWRAGIGLKRILIAGAGELGRLVPTRSSSTASWAIQIVGFVDDRAVGDHLGYRGLPAARHARGRGGDFDAGRHRPPVRRAAAGTARADAAADREHEPRDGGRARSSRTSCR